VLIRRSFNDLFFGSFRFTFDEDLSPQTVLSKPMDQSKQAEPVLFDPSARPIGKHVDAQNLEAAGCQVLLFGTDYSPSKDDTLLHGFNTPVPGEDVSQNLTGDHADHANQAHDGSPAQSQIQGKAKSSMMYHTKQRHVHIPHHTPKITKKQPTNHDLEMQPLHSPTPSHDSDAWPSPTRYITTHEMGFNMFGLRITRSGVRCIRSIRMTLTQSSDSGPPANYEASGHWSMMGMLLHKRQYHDEAKGVSPDRYLVVGRMSTNGYVIKEKIFRYKEHDEEMMLRRLHRAVQAVRGTRGWFSLKKVSGFGLYQVCSPSTCAKPPATNLPSRQS
jgi:hypothetical protein